MLYRPLLCLWISLLASQISMARGELQVGETTITTTTTSGEAAESSALRQRRDKFKVYDIWIANNPLGKKGGKKGGSSSNNNVQGTGSGKKEKKAKDAKEKNVIHHLHDYVNYTDSDSSSLIDNIDDDDAVVEGAHANEIFALALVAVAIILILCALAGFYACRFRERRGQKKEFQEQLHQVQNIVQVSCDELWLPSAEEKGEEEGNAKVTDKLSAPQTPQEGDYVASYFKNGELRKLTVHLSFVKSNDHKHMAWFVSGHGVDDGRGSFQVPRGLVSRTGCVYWVQQFRYREQWFVTGQLSFALGTFVGNWVTDSGVDGPFTSFERADRIVDVDDCYATGEDCEDYDGLKKMALAGLSAPQGRSLDIAYGREEEYYVDHCGYHDDHSTMEDSTELDLSGSSTGFDTGSSRSVGTATTAQSEEVSEPRRNGADDEEGSEDLTPGKVVPEDAPGSTLDTLNDGADDDRVDDSQVSSVVEDARSLDKPSFSHDDDKEVSNCSTCALTLSVNRQDPPVVENNSLIRRGSMHCEEEDMSTETNPDEGYKQSEKTVSTSLQGEEDRDENEESQTPNSLLPNVRVSVVPPPVRDTVRDSTRAVCGGEGATSTL